MSPSPQATKYEHSNTRYLAGKFRSSRRKMLKVFGGSALASFGPYIHAQPKPKLRVIGYPSSLGEDIRLRAQEDLGIELEFSPDQVARIFQRITSTPESIDIVAQGTSIARTFLNSGVILPIDTTRIAHWDEVSPLYKSGQISADATIGAGDAPHKNNYIYGDGSPTSEQTDLVSFVPHMGDLRSFIYNADQIDSGVEYETQSWAWLLDKRFQGKVGITINPTGGTFDLALAARAARLVQFENIGSITRGEVDRLFEILIELKATGHFGGFWTSASESVDFLQSGRVIIEGMATTTLSGARSGGVNARVAAPKEGYRGWQGGLFLSSQISERQKDIAYEYLGWWLSGWPGAYMSRSGYYASTPNLSRKWMTKAEWEYWYEGRAASEDIKGNDGEIVAIPGERRSGGSYQERMSQIAVWNTEMSNHGYILQRWYELQLV